MKMKKIRNPIYFQGKIKRKNYFEGWYFKQYSLDGTCSISFIPGISLFNEDVHSFIQYIYCYSDSDKNKIVKSGYIKFSLKDFEVSYKPFVLKIGKNMFSEKRIFIDIHDKGNDIRAEFSFGKLGVIKRNFFMPSIMGFFAYIPSMQCSHGIVSMTHSVNGFLSIDENNFEIKEGKGYIEKDWGSSFPKKYIWLQCNNFKDKSTSLFVSIAMVPILKKRLLGFVSNFVYKNNEYRFATYNMSKLEYEINKDSIRVSLQNKKGRLYISAKMISGKSLIAPRQGKMQK